MKFRQDYPKLSKNTSKKNGFSRGCDAKGCDCEGLYRAPKTRDLKDYYWFCLKHVKEYNNKWNFFKDLSFEEIEKEQMEDIYGAKTKKFGVKNKSDFFNKVDDTLNMFGRFKSSGVFGESDVVKKREFLPKEKRAMKLFELKENFTAEELKKSYKKLVKNHHPDRHGGDKAKENDFKKIVEYNDVLKKLIK